MAKYIDVEPLIKDGWQLQRYNSGDGYVNQEHASLKDIPPADVRPVVRGRWELDSDGIPHCTECGYVAPQRLFLQVQSLACTTRFIMSNYCPDCGSNNSADMRGGDADGDEKD